jgi:hypothetical protein
METIPRTWLLNDLSLLASDVGRLRQHLDWLAQDWSLLPQAGIVTPAGALNNDQLAGRLTVVADALADLDWLVGQLRLAATRSAE